MIFKNKSLINRIEHNLDIDFNDYFSRYGHGSVIRPIPYTYAYIVQVLIDILTAINCLFSL
jgi:hypothetical protein